MSKKNLTIVILFILMVAGVAAYLYLLVRGNKIPGNSNPTPTVTSTNIFPFTSPTVSPSTSLLPTNDIDNPNQTSSSPNASVPKLQHISLTPISGAVATTTGSTTLIRYVDRGTGHVLERSLDNPTTHTLSNTTIPKVYEAYWNKNGTSLLLRYLTELDNSISTFSVFLSPIKNTITGTTSSELATTPFEIKGVYLPNIKNIALSPKTDKMFSISLTNNGAVGSISTLTGTSKKALWSSPLSNWQTEWPEEKTLSVTTAATGLENGFSYLVNATTGKVTKVLGPTKGLTTLVSKDVKKILLSESQGQTVATGVLDVTTGQIQNSSFRTLPEKCVWSSLNVNDLYCAIPIGITNALYPDDWYKGKVSFTDQIWYINTETGDAHLLSNLYDDSKDIIDVINPMLDNKEQVLLFTNKNDLTLWALSLH